MMWRLLMMRVFAVDVLECSVCRGTMKSITEITDRKVTERFLGVTELPTEAAEIGRARPPPQLELPLNDRDQRGIDEITNADASHDWA